MDQPFETPPPQSTKTLLISLFVALLLAVIVLVFALLPAEYGIDYTGLGRKMGLVDFYHASQKAPPKRASVAPPKMDFRVDTAEIVIPPGVGIEYKVSIDRGASFKYAWATADSSAIYFDFHGELRNDKSGFFDSMAIGTSPSLEGTYTAPFDGTHGWYWKNAGSEPVVITLQLKGRYEVIGIPHNH